MSGTLNIPFYLQLQFHTEVMNKFVKISLTIENRLSEIINLTKLEI